MIHSLTIDELVTYTGRQLNNFFPDKEEVNLHEHKAAVQKALDRLDFCYKHVVLKNYYNGEQSLFNHLQSDHYLMYLWFLGNTIWKEKQDKTLCNKLYYLNKSLHAFDCMYDTNLPDIFLIFHGAGTMLGKATYSDFFVALQGCTVGINKGKYPVMGKGVGMSAHSALIGDSLIGKNVTVSFNTSVTDTTIEDGMIVFNDQQGAVQQKVSRNPYAQSFFSVPI